MSSTTVLDRLAPRSLPIVVGILAFTLAGCAGTASDTDSPPADPEVSSPADSEVDESSGAADEDGAGAELGTITFDAATYGVVEAVNCEPVQTTTLVTEVFNVIAVAQSADGDTVLFSATTQEESGGDANYVFYQGPEGTWSTQDGDATFVLENGVMSGATAIIDDDSTQAAMVEFEFAVPDGLVEC